MPLKGTAWAPHPSCGFPLAVTHCEAQSLRATGGHKGHRLLGSAVDRALTSVVSSLSVHAACVTAGRKAPALAAPYPAPWGPGVGGCMWGKVGR